MSANGTAGQKISQDAREYICMGKNRRVVVTGMGAITPIGNSVEEFWNGIKEGKTGFGPITYFDTADYRCKLAAEVKDFDPAQYMDKKSARRMEQFCQFAVAAADRPSRMLVSTWNRKILIWWAAVWEAASEVYRPWSGNMTA